MQDPFEKFFAQRMRPVKNGEDRRADAIRVAACALMLELAHADDEFSESERTHIEVVLRRHFALDEATALEIMQLAEAARERERGVHRFAALIRDQYDLGQKLLLAEILWGVVMADGAIARHEAYLLRRIGSLLDLESGYLARARSRIDETLH